MLTYLIDIVYKTDYSLSDFKYEDGEEYEKMFEKADEFFNEFISRESVIKRLEKDGLTVEEVMNNRDNYFIVSVVPPDENDDIFG